MPTKEKISECIGVSTETMDSNIFLSSQSNVRYKTMKSQLVHQLNLKAVSTFA